MMSRSCPACAYELRWLRLRCPDCRRSTVSWLHVALAAAFDAAGLVYLLKLVWPCATARARRRRVRRCRNNALVS